MCIWYMYCRNLVRFPFAIVLEYFMQKPDNTFAICSPFISCDVYVTFRLFFAIM